MSIVEKSSFRYGGPVEKMRRWLARWAVIEIPVGVLGPLTGPGAWANYAPRVWLSSIVSNSVAGSSAMCSLDIRLARRCRRGKLVSVVDMGGFAPVSLNISR
jgi:hypothetical protein